MKNASILNQAKQNEQAAITVAATAQAQKWAKQQLAARQKQEEETKNISNSLTNLQFLFWYLKKILTI